MTTKPELTSAEAVCHRAIAALLEPHTGFRAAVVIVTYGDGSERGGRIANAIGMQPTVQAATDAFILVQRLRRLADELEDVIQGKRPLPQQSK